MLADTHTRRYRHTHSLEHYLEHSHFNTQLHNVPEAIGCLALVASEDALLEKAGLTGINILLELASYYLDLEPADEEAAQKAQKRADTLLSDHNTASYTSPPGASPFMGYGYALPVARRRAQLHAFFPCVSIPLLQT